MFNSRRQFSNNRSSNRFGGRRNFPRQRSFDPSWLVKQAVGRPKLDVQVITHEFADFKVGEQLHKNIKERGYTIPTPIQDQAIPLILEGKDVVGIANTGTGKTAAFLIPLIDKVVKKTNEKVLIITPTRELAVQIEEEFMAMARGLNIGSCLCIGGVGLGRQINGLRRRPQFVIGTPGRLKDLEQRRSLYLSDFATIVLDEVDRMLDMGFIHDIQGLIAGLPKIKHALFFSATIPENVRGVMRGFLNNPTTVSVKSQDITENVHQEVERLNGRQKIEVLHELLIKEGFDKVLVFGRTKWGMEKLAKELIQRGFKATAIHGNKSQSQRQRALNSFKRGEVNILLATDVASRGLDIDDVTHVINYDLPESQDDYIHRIGRTGRADKKGIAITLVE